MYEIENEDIYYIFADDVDSHMSADDISTARKVNIAMTIATGVMTLGSFYAGIHYANEYTELKEEFLSEPAGQESYVWKGIRRASDSAIQKLGDLRHNDLYGVQEELNHIEETLNSLLQKNNAHYEETISQLGNLAGDDGYTSVDMLNSLSEKANYLEDINNVSETLSRAKIFLDGGHYSFAKNSLFQVSDEAKALELSYISKIQDLYNDMKFAEHSQGAVVLGLFSGAAFLGTLLKKDWDSI